MSKLNIIFEIASCASLIIAAGTTASNLIEEPEELNIVEVQEERTEADNPSPTIIKTEQAEEPNKSTTNPESTETTANQHTPAPNTPTYKYSNYLDFEKAYMGWCPQSVPKDAYHLPLSRAAALGYRDIDYFSYKNPEEAAIYVWSWWQVASISAKNHTSAFIDIYYRKMNNPIIGDDGLTYNNFTIQADAYTKTVTWALSSKASKDTLPQNVINQMDTVILQIKNKMIQLDQQYIAKCGA